MSKEKHNANAALDAEEAAELEAGNESAEASAAEQSAGTMTGDEAEITPAGEQIAALAAERDRLREQNRELADQVLRRQADFENYRRRIENERAELSRYAGMETVRELLPVLDDFERALDAAPKLEGAEAEFVKGVGMIHQRLLTALEKAGLEPLESEGKPFDPNVHHAVESVETDEAEDQTVLEEWQKGYTFKGKLLREAMVRVAVKPSAPAEETESE